MSAEVFPSTNRGGKTNQYQLRVRIPLDLHKEMIRLAADAGISQSDYMVRLLADKVFDEKRQAINLALDTAIKNPGSVEYNPIRDEPSMSSGYDGLEENPLWLQRQEENHHVSEAADDLMAVLRSRR